MNTTHDAKEYVETLPIKLNGNEAVMEIDEVNRVGATEKIQERQRTSLLTIERKTILEKKPKKKKPTFLQRMKNARTRRNTKGKKEQMKINNRTIFDCESIDLLINDDKLVKEQ